MAAEYRRKPETVTAVLWTGENVEEIREFLAGDKRCGVVQEGLPVAVWNADERSRVPIPVGHWAVRTAAGEVFGCSQRLFNDMYEPIG